MRDLQSIMRNSTVGWKWQGLAVVGFEWARVWAGRLSMEVEVT